MSVNRITLESSVDLIVDAMGQPISIYDNAYVLMGRENGKDVTEIQHLIRSLIDLFTTPIGSMPTLREYGCNLFSYIDRPCNASLRLDMISAITMATDRWEPRIILQQVELFFEDDPGSLTLNLQGVYLLGGQIIKLDNVRLDFKKEVALSNQYAL